MSISTTGVKTHRRRSRGVWGDFSPLLLTSTHTLASRRGAYMSSRAHAGHPRSPPGGFAIWRRDRARLVGRSLGPSPATSQPSRSSTSRRSVCPPAKFAAAHYRLSATVLQAKSLIINGRRTNTDKRVGQSSMFGAPLRFRLVPVLQPLTPSVGVQDRSTHLPGTQAGDRAIFPSDPVAWDSTRQDVMHGHIGCADETSDLRLRRPKGVHLG